MKNEKLVPVYVLCPNDSEYSVQYFTSRQEALEWEKTYKSGAYVSKEAELIPESVIQRKQLKTARKGYRI